MVLICQQSYQYMQGLDPFMMIYAYNTFLCEIRPSHCYYVCTVCMAGYHSENTWVSEVKCNRIIENKRNKKKRPHHLKLLCP